MHPENQSRSPKTPQTSERVGVDVPRLVRLIDPAPQWEENPTPDGDGYWGGRFRVLRYAGGNEPSVDVDEEWITPPDDMKGAEPQEIEGRWHWILNSMPNASDDR